MLVWLSQFPPTKVGHTSAQVPWTCARAPALNLESDTHGHPSISTVIKKGNLGPAPSGGDVSQIVCLIRRSHTLYTCSGGCVLVTIRHSVVCVRLRSLTATVIGHAMHSSYPSLPVSPFGFPPFPSLLFWAGFHRQPTALGDFCFGLSVGCWCTYRAGTV